MRFVLPFSLVRTDAFSSVRQLCDAWTASSSLTESGRPFDILITPVHPYGPSPSSVVPHGHRMLTIAFPFRPQPLSLTTTSHMSATPESGTLPTTLARRFLPA